MLFRLSQQHTKMDRLTNVVIVAHTANKITSVYPKATHVHMKIPTIVDMLIVKQANMHIRFQLDSENKYSPTILLSERHRSNS